MHLLTGLLLIVGLSWGKSSNRFPAEFKLNCSKQVEAFLNKQSVSDSWKKMADSNDVKVYRAPTNEIGRWVELQLSSNPLIYVFSEKGIDKHQWSASNCEKLITSTGYPIDFLKKGKAAHFDDASLRKIISSKESVMIYVWSPAMTYSMQSMENFKAAAKKFNLKFIPLVDPNASSKEIKEAINVNKLKVEVKKMGSLELYMREATIHFPETYIVHNGKISQEIIGAMSVAQAEREVKLRLESMAKEN